MSHTLRTHTPEETVGGLIVMILHDLRSIEKSFEAPFISSCSNDLDDRVDHEDEPTTRLMILLNPWIP